MFRRVTVINNKGAELPLDLYHPELSDLVLINITGLGIDQVAISTTSLGSMDGAIFNNSRMEPRNIVIDVMMDYTKNNIEGIRHKMQEYFLPNVPITLVFDLDEIHCQIKGYVDKVDPLIFESRERAQISIICPDPCFYANDYSLFTFSGANPLFEFPFSNESLVLDLIEFGELLEDPRAHINYKGSLKTGMVIRIDFMSESDNIAIYNVDTGEELRINMDMILSNFLLQPTRGDYIEINTVTGNKSAKLYKASESKWYDILGAIDINSDWLQLTPGLNVFDYHAEHNTDKNLTFTFNWKDAYAAI